jgi:hypothetical protein
MASKKPYVPPLDLEGEILAALHDSKLQPIKSSPDSRHLQKFKIKSPGRCPEEVMTKILSDHFTAHGIEVRHFKHLCGECIFKGQRYFIVINISDWFIDGSITIL